MESKTTIRICLTLFLLSILALRIDVHSARAEPRTWTVDDDAPADFHTIQEAINTAYDKDTIFVNNGTYYENVVVNKTVALIGETMDITFIHGSHVAISIISDNVRLSGFTIRDSSHAINISSAKNVTISNNLIANLTYDGITVDGQNNVLSNNTIMECFAGILIYGQSITVKKNT